MSSVREDEYGSVPTESIGSASAGVRGAGGALAVAGSVASLGGLKVEGCLGANEGDGAIDAGDNCEGLRVVPPAVEAGARDWLPGMNFGRGSFGGGVGVTFRVFKATLEIGEGRADFGGFRLVLIWREAWG